MRNKPLKVKSQAKNLTSQKVRTRRSARSQRMPPRLKRQRPKRRRSWSRRKRRRPLLLKVPPRREAKPRKKAVRPRKRRRKLISSHQSWPALLPQPSESSLLDCKTWFEE